LNISYEVIFLDRDGTLNFDPGFVEHVSQFTFYDFTLPALRILSGHGNQFCIVSNQSGVGRGLINIDDLNDINNYIRREFTVNKINLLDIYTCIDHPNEPTNRRKPGTGMFLDAANDHNLELENCMMIGDSERDLIPAHILGMDTMLVLTGNGHLTLDTISEVDKPTYIVKNILEGGKLLIQN